MGNEFDIVDSLLSFRICVIILAVFKYDKIQLITVDSVNIVEVHCDCY